MRKEHLSCKKIVNYICTELDEHIDSPQCREIKKHLKDLDSLKKTVRLYRKYPNPKVREQCRKKLFAALELGKQKSRSVKKRSNR